LDVGAARKDAFSRADSDPKGRYYSGKKFPENGKLQEYQPSQRDISSVEVFTERLVICFVYFGFARKILIFPWQDFCTCSEVPSIKKMAGG